ncbi:MAG: class F sortase [Marmoricola sp.]
MTHRTHRSTAPAGTTTIVVGVVASLALAAFGLLVAFGWKGEHTVVASTSAPLPATSSARPTVARKTPAHGACATQPQPSGITVPAVCIQGPIKPTYVSRDEVVLPADVKSIFLWDQGASLTSTLGTTLLVAHVHYGSLGDGVFYPLSQVQAGDQVNIRDSAGTLTRWRIVSSRSYLKTSLPQDVFAGPHGPRRLVLVTCGGAVLPSGSGYEDNVVVTAIPA